MRASWAITGSRSSVESGARRAAALLFALVFLGAASRPASAQGGVDFYLSNEGFVGPGEVTAIRLSGRNLRRIDFRVYRLTDPLAFFRAQPNPHSPRPVALKTAVPEAASLRETLREVRTTAARGYRDLARAVVVSDLRGHLADALEISTREEARPERTTPAGAVNVPLLSDFTLVRQFSFEAKPEKRNWWTSNTVPLFEKGATVGAYLVEAVAGGKRAYTVALVTNLRYVAKQGPSNEDKLLVFVAQADSGKPVSGARVVALRPDDEPPSAQQASVEAATDTNGLAFLPPLRRSQGLMVTRGDDFLLGQAYFYFEAEDWEAEGPVLAGRRGRVYIYTDRPVYRPGHQVFFKAILRSQDREGRYQTERAASVSVAALDAMNRKIYEAQLASNELGSLEGSFTLASEPALGAYSLEVQWANRSYYGHFRVEEYKKPEFEVSIATDREQYVSGDPMTVAVQANYYFGDPVAGGKLEYEVYQAYYYRPWWTDYDLQWFFAGEEGYESYDFELVEQGEGSLDEKGSFQVTLRTQGRERDALFRIVARVTDSTNRQISGSRRVPLAAGTFRIEVDSERYAAAAGEPLSFSLRTSTAAGEAVSQALQLEVFRRRWEGGASFQDRVETAEVRTGATGRASFRFTPAEPGSYFVAVSAADERGNRLRTDYSFWAWSSKPWWAEAAGSGLTLTADRKTYAGGETAQLLLVSPVENPTVLFTVEGPSLLEHRVLSVSGSTATIPLPIKDSFSPNVYVSATAVSGGRFFEKTDTLVIPPKNRFLDIKIRTDKPAYQPGEKVQLEVAASDERGHPVDAELSIGVVDQAVYAISPEVVPDIKAFFYGKRPNHVRTNLSTSYYMYSSSMEAQLRRNDDSRWADVKTVAETKVRKIFKDTMFWQAVVRTGSAGVARLPLATPDNLTTWRITVRAADRDTRVGQTTATFITRKDLMVRLGLPRFFRVRDGGEVLATVHNSQEKAATVRVKLEAQGIDLEGPLEKTLQMNQQTRETLAWSYRVRQPGSARFTVYALSEGKSDAEQIEIPVLPHGLEVSEASTALLEKDRESVRLSLEATGAEAADSLEARLSLAPSLGGPLLSSIDYLVGYPYGCVEQTMSSFLPTVLVTQALTTLGVEAPARSGKLAEVPQMVEKGLARLYNFQHEDGGWGWWENDETHPFMTAYVLYGLGRARGSGFAVDEGVIERGRSAALAALARPALDLSTRSYLLYALAVSGSTDRTMVEKLFERRQELAKDLNSMSRALLVLTLQHHGLTEPARRMLDELLAETRRLNGFAYWEGASFHYEWHNDSLLTTAAALRAILAVEPQREEAVSAVRWLMSRRYGDHWRSTLDTAQVLYAMVEYLLARREFAANFEVEVSADGRPLLKQRFGRDDLFKSPLSLAIPAEALRSGAIEIKKTGVGNLYATLTRTYFTQEEDIPALKSGPLRIDRQYFRLQLSRQSDGSFGYRRTPLGEGGAVKPGDLILVMLNPAASADSEYVMIEDMLPSGFEVIEDIRGWRIEGVPYQEYDPYGWGYWYTHRAVRDTRVAFFSTYFEQRGQKSLHYVLRAQTPGEYHAMPARIELMYYPETRANSREMRMQVSR
jgi:uncharacterized protein YfaS (alpha-2-macroglobulin family)